MDPREQSAQPTTPEAGAQSLDTIMVDGLQQFNLGAAEGPGAGQGDLEPAPTPGGEGPQGEPPPASAAATDSPADPGDQNYQRLQTKAQKLEQDNAKLSREKKELEDKLAAGTAAADKVALDEAFIATAKAVNKQALEAIDGLDPDAADYRDQVAEIWARANQQVAGIQTAPAAPAQPTAAPASESAPAPVGNEGRDGEAEKAARAQMADACKAANLDANDRVFISFAQEAPVGLPFEQQLEWAITETKKIKDAERSRLLQELDTPLGRGGGGLPAGAGGDQTPAGPVTLDAAINSANQSRVL